MNQGFVSDEQQVADVVFDADVDDIARFLQGHASTFFWIKAIHGKPAKITLRVTNVRDGKLEVTWSSVLKHLANELEQAGFRPVDRLGKISARVRAASEPFRLCAVQDSRAHSVNSCILPLNPLKANLSWRSGDDRPVLLRRN